MALLIIFTISGMFIGALAFEGNGWLIGGVLGFLITKIIQMTDQIKQLQRSVNVLQEQQNNSKKLEANSAKNEESAEPPRQVDQALPPASTEKLAAIGIIPPNSTTASTVENSSPQITKAKTGQASNEGRNSVAIALAHVKRFFTEGNPIVRIGMVVMFFGLSFLVKYASNQGLLPLELRLTAVAAVAITLIALGWKTRMREGGYGLVLQGGGVAALYLTVFAAAKMYSLMPASAALGLMLLVVILGAALAVMQNARVLAVIATAGGFIAPILTSDGSGNHVALFSFYLLLNIGILGVAWFKTWRILNWLGFIFTFVISVSWGVLQYEPHHYSTIQPFLLAFFTLYLMVSVLFSLKQPPDLKGLVDGTLIFGLPIVAFGLQAALLKHTEYGLAISAIALATIYIALAFFLWRKFRKTHGVLVESFIALGLCFATLSIPLALDAQWTSATWALEAAGLVWIGLRQNRLLPRIAGYLLHFSAALSLFVNGIDAGNIPILKGAFLGLVILSLSAGFIAYLINIHAQNVSEKEQRISAFSLNIAWLWWIFAGCLEIYSHVAGEYHLAGVLTLFSGSIGILILLGKKIGWHSLVRLGYWLLPLTILCSMSVFGESLFIGYTVYPSQHWNLPAFLLFAFIQYQFLRRCCAQGAVAIQGIYHVLTAWFIFSLGYWEAAHWQQHFQWYGTSEAILWFVCLAVPLTALLYVVNKPLWPFNVYQNDYKNLVPSPLLFLLFCWFLYASCHSGETNYFHLPLLNPLDIAQAAALIISAYAIKRSMIGLDNLPSAIRYGLLGGLGFVWLNVVLLRALSSYANVDYTASSLWNSVLVQMSLSILWAICALVIMNISRRTQMRQLWLVGAGILALVLIKLFTKDLTGTGTLARIISFMVVGGLMLLIGYLSPIPAKAKVIDKTI